MALTAGERRALSWLLAVIMVGAGVRAVRYWRHADAVLPGAAEALRVQLLAVDSAQRAGRRARPGRSAGGSAGADRRRRSSRNAMPGSADATIEAGRSGQDVADGSQQPRLLSVDVDVADSTALERLPRIGPALAARIVADRAAHGPFGSLAGLERVRGIGPRLAQALAAHVTFSGSRRPSAVQR